MKTIQYCLFSNLNSLDELWLHENEIEEIEINSRYELALQHVKKIMKFSNDGLTKYESEQKEGIQQGNKKNNLRRNKPSFFLKSYNGSHTKRPCQYIYHNTITKRVKPTDRSSKFKTKNKKNLVKLSLL